jgi:hypothetical protein
MPPIIGWKPTWKGGEPIRRGPRRIQPNPVRKFDTGATRNDDTEELDYEAYLSPLVLERYARYMAHHAVQSDGQKRTGDNWQKGIPITSYIKSLIRHTMDLWFHHRGHPKKARVEDPQDALCAIIFNASGYLYELLKEKEA